MRAVRLSPIRVFSVTGLALFCTGLQAQSAAPEPSAALPTMVVTGTRTELLLSDSPVRTDVITREQIARSHAVDLKQVLEMVPGLSLSRLHGKAGYEVWMQGVDGNRVLVLIDGYPTARSTNNATDLLYAMLQTRHCSFRRGKSVLNAFHFFLQKKNRRGDNFP